MSHDFSIHNSPLFQSLVNQAEKQGTAQNKKVENENEVKGLTENEKKHKRLLGACQDFESIFVAYMFKTMRDANLQDEDEENLFGQDFGGGMFRDMFEGEVAKKMASGRGTGLAVSLYKSLKQNLPPVDPSFDPYHVQSRPSIIPPSTTKK